MTSVLSVLNLKRCLSVAALLVNAIALVLASGQPVQVSPQVLFGVQSVFGALGILGVSPIDLPDVYKRLCSAVAAVGAAFIGIHAGSVHAGLNPHPWFWASFGFMTAVVGVLGKSLIPHAEPMKLAVDDAAPRAQPPESAPKT